MTALTQTGSEGPEGTEDRLLNLKKKALDDAAKLLEQVGFDAFIILATYDNEGGGSEFLNVRRGNYYAQTGMMRAMLLKRQRELEMDVEADKEDD